MKDQLRIVLDLNQRDAAISQMREEFEEIPARRDELEESLQTKRQGIEEKNRALDELEKVKKIKERDVEILQVRIKEFEGRLSQIKTNKEYQAGLKEMADSRRMNKTMEDQILELMNQMEGLKKEREALEEPLKSEEVAFEKEKRALDERENEIQKSIQEVEEQKKELLNQIEPSLLSLYQKVRKMRRDAISFIESGACGGCHMRVPPQLSIEIQKLKAVHSCPSCHRILYLHEWYPQASAEKVKEGGI